MAETALGELKKLVTGPLLPMLDAADIQLQTDLQIGKNAEAPEVLAALDAKRGDGAGAVVDMLRIIALTLPPREAVWWACLSARDLVGHDTELPKTSCVATAEAWVFKPGDETRLDAYNAMVGARTSDKTKSAAQAAVFGAGTMGPGIADDAKTPPGLLGNVVFGMLMTSISASPDKKGVEWMDFLLERGLEIARGGNGRSVEAPGPPPKPADEA